jgi:RNA polymerase-binding transcription factor DksA
MATKKAVAKKLPPAKKTVKPVAKKSVSKKAAKPIAKTAPTKKSVKPTSKTAKVNKATNTKVEKPKPGKPVIKKAKAVKPVPKKPASKAVPPKAVKPEPVKEVKVPKTSVKTSVPYQPGYTPLEKRADSPKTNEPLVRYSDNDLTEFRNLINKKLEGAKKELAYLQGLITRKDDMGGDETDNRYMTMEDGSMSMEREQLSQMASRQITYIDHLEKALIRIENKTYGICRVTGKLIDKARLRAVPHATLSLEAKLGLVRSGNE